jgi:hypothetical protein
MGVKNVQDGNNQFSEYPAKSRAGSDSRLFIAVYAFAAVFLLVLFTISRVSGISLKYFTADPFSLSEPHYYNGFVSNIDILLWCTVVVSCLLTYAVIRRDRQQQKWSRFFLFSGLMSLMLMLDDLYMFHDYIMPGKLHLPQEIVYSLYLLVLVGYLVYSGRMILKTNYWPFAVALIFFGISLGFDVVQRPVGDLIGNQSIEYLIDDGAKFLALAGWSSYFLMTSAGMLRHVFTTEKA